LLERCRVFFVIVFTSESQAQLACGLQELYGFPFLNAAVGQLQKKRKKENEGEKQHIKPLYLEGIIRILKACLNRIWIRAEATEKCFDVLSLLE